MVINAISTMKKTKRQLHEAGSKLTPRKETTLFVLLENGKEHLSTEEIFFLVKEENPETGLATVYRAPEVLVELKAVDRVSFNNGLARYDLRKEGVKHFHHHLLCLNCGTVKEIEEDPLLEVKQVVEERYHFLVRDRWLTFHGICQEHYGREKRNQSVRVSRRLFLYSDHGERLSG